MRSSGNRPKAFSYLRFSTPEQAKGDSRRRQLEAASEYARLNGLELDTELRLHDEGVSAFRAKNARQGALGKFLQAVDEGLVPEGSFLLVENLDRVSRAAPWDALPIFQQIINAGITIVTLQDQRVWSVADIRENPFRIFESLMVMIRANEESLVKARRLKAAWNNKRANATSTRLTKIAPAWVTPARGKNGFELVPERAAVVRRIFDMAADGSGQHRIAAVLNDEGVPTFGRARHWHRSYIKKILANPAAIGRAVPHEIAETPDGKRRRRPLTPVEDYFPAVVDKDQFDIVQAISRGGRSRSGRHTQVRNILAGLAKCPRCGAGVTRWTDGRRHYLVCTGKRARTGCDLPNVRYEPVESALLAERGAAFEYVAPPGVSQLQMDHLLSLELTLDGQRDKARKLVAAIRDGEGPSRLLALELAAVEADISVTSAELVRARDLEAGLGGQQWERRLGALLQACELGDVPRVNQALRAMVDRVEVVDGAVDLYLRHGEMASVTIPEFVLQIAR